MEKNPHIKIVEADNGKRKTQRYLIINRKRNIPLAEIRWYVILSKYVFEPGPLSIFDATCLTYITLFLNRLISGEQIIEFLEDE